MMKLFLLLAVLAFVAWYLTGQRKKGSDSKTQSGTTENIVICAHCRLHVPESESISFGGRHYCCEDHRKLGAP